MPSIVNFKTKKDFKQALNNNELILMENPSMFAPFTGILQEYMKDNKMKLDNTSKAIIRNIVGRCHVSDSNDTVTKKVKAKLGKGWTKDPRHIGLLIQVFEFAIKVHSDNNKLFNTVTKGQTKC